MIKKGETYIIGEIGQNHNGSVDIAKLIVDLVCRPVKEEVFGLSLKPINAVKLTKRDLNEELSTSQMNRIYDTPNYPMRSTWRFISMLKQKVWILLKRFVLRAVCLC